MEVETAVVGRAELTDRAWAQLAPLLPRNARRGGRWRDHPAVLNGIVWKLRTGAPWRGLKQFRAVATRFDKRAVNYRAMVVLASLLIWLGG